VVEAVVVRLESRKVLWMESMAAAWGAGDPVAWCGSLVRRCAWEC